jgi:glycosyltransferase involved in cell wall biosynthesis
METSAQEAPISVVIPAYNRAELLAATLHSVVRQTVQPAEVIVVDDGSETEAVGAVAREHQAVVIRQENAGESAARNTGLRAARYPWVAFLDSDDLWLPRKLELQWSALAGKKGGEFGAVIANFEVVTPNGIYDRSAFEVNVAYQRIEKNACGEHIYELSMTSASAALAHSMFAQPSGVLVSREVAREVGAFDLGLRRCADHDFALRVFGVTRVLSVEEPVFRYRVHANNISNSEPEMRIGAVTLADKVIAHPHWYPACAASIMAEARPGLVYRAAASLMKKGDVAGAREWLRPIRRHNSRAAALYAAASLLPGHVPAQYAQGALELWRRRPWRKRVDWGVATLVPQTTPPD